jgi:hypothetical protein
MPEYVYIVSKKFRDRHPEFEWDIPIVFHSKEDVLRFLGDNYEAGTRHKKAFQFPDERLRTTLHFGRNRNNPDFSLIHKVQFAEVYRRPGANEDPTNLVNQGGGHRKRKNQTRKRLRT